MQETAQQVGQKAQEVRAQAGERVRQELDTRSTQAGDQVSTTADAIRRVGEQLRKEGNPGPAKYADQVAERIERLGTYLSQANADRMLHDVESFARRQPWLTAFGARGDRVLRVPFPQGVEREPLRTVLCGERPGEQRWRLPLAAISEWRSLSDPGRRWSRRRRPEGAGDVDRSNSSDELRQAQLRDRSTGELVKQLASETTTLVKQELELARGEATRMGEAVVTLARQELQLAKAEMAEKGRTAGPGFGMIGAAGAAALLATGALSAFLILALDGVMPNWLAALLVALGWSVVAGALYFMGKESRREGRPARS